MKVSRLLFVISFMLVLPFATNVEAQNAKKKVWDSAKKTWVWVEKKVAKNVEKKALERSEHKVRPHVAVVDCNRCSGYGKVQVTIPVTVWNPYYQCYQTQYQTQIQVCAQCQGSGKVYQKVYY